MQEVFQVLHPLYDLNEVSFSGCWRKEIGLIDALELSKQGILLNVLRAKEPLM
jgi:hypothetical protein